MFSPIFNNQSVGKEVTIDLDVFFENFIRKPEDVPEDERIGINIYSTRDRIARLEKYAFRRVFAKYRKSSSGNVHVRLYFDSEVSVLDAFMIRAWMMDDQTRLELDLARYLSTNDLNEMNRTFDDKGKIENGEVVVKQAGEWIPINQIPDVKQEQKKEQTTFLGFV